MRNIFEYKNNFIEHSSVKSHLLWGDVEYVKGPEVSVIIPCFKRQDFFVQSIKSALNQTYSGIYEVVICDNTPLCDESTNIDLIKGIDDKRILYFRNEKNIGMYGNWNRLIELARSPFVVFLHDDDLLLPNALEDLVSIQKKFNADGVTASHNDIDSSGTIVRQAVFPQDEPKLFVLKPKKVSRASLFDLFMGIKGGFGCGCLYRKEAIIKIGGFSPDFYPSADYVLNSVFAKDYKLYYSYKPTFAYRIAANESFSIYKQFAEVDRHFRKCMKKNISLPSIFLDRLIVALYRSQKIYFKIKWEGDNGTLKAQLRKSDLWLCRIVNIIRTFINDYTLFK